MSTTSDKAKQIVEKINALNHTSISIDIFLAREQLIGELSQEEINFSKLPRYGCPSDFITCDKGCEGDTSKRAISLCAKCWEEALKDEAVVSTQESPSDEKVENPFNLQESGNYFSVAADALLSGFSKKNELKSFKDLGLSEKQVVNVFQILGWDKSMDYKEFCKEIQKLKK